MSKPDKTLLDLTAEVLESFAGYDVQGTKSWTWESAAKDLTYQVGSIAKIMLQLTGERWPENKTEAQLKAELSDELADVLAETLFIAAKLGIDMNQAWQNMLAMDRRKQSERS
jgi:NTP pyrophosphatase (non-canonical NTP hydrolase)